MNIDAAVNNIAKTLDSISRDGFTSHEAQIEFLSSISLVLNVARSQLASIKPEQITDARTAEVFAHFFGSIRDVERFGEFIGKALAIARSKPEQAYRISSTAAYVWSAESDPELKARFFGEFVHRFLSNFAAEELNAILKRLKNQGLVDEAIISPN